MNDPDTASDEVGEALSAAHDAEHAIQRLCRSTMSRPSMTPAELDIILAHLAEAAAAIPQAARQLGDMLHQSQQDHVLEMDSLTETKNPDRAIATARHHLGRAGESALGLHLLLDAAHNQTAHIAARARTLRQRYERAPMPVATDVPSDAWPVT